MSFAFQITSGSDKGQVYQLVDGFIGTLPQCSLQFSNPSIAPLQAKLTYRNGAFVIADLTDTPSLFVNDLRVKTRALAKGDIVRMADVVMEVIDTAGNVGPKVIIHDASGPIVTGDDAAPSVTQQLKMDPPEDAHTDTDSSRPRDSEFTKVLAGYGERSQLEESAAAHTGHRVVYYVLVACIILLPPATLVGYILHKHSEHQHMTAMYQETCDLAARPDTEPQVKIEAFVKIRNLAQMGHPGIADLAADRIAEEKKKVLKNETAFQALLQKLDILADKAAAIGQFSEAAEIYRNADRKLEKRIREARATRLEEWKQRAEVTASMPANITPVVEPGKTPAQPDIDARLNPILASTVDLALAGKIDEAAGELNKISSEHFPDETVAKARETAASLKVLQMLDRIQQETGSMPTNEVMSAPTMIRAFLALRRKELLEAQAMIRKNPQSLLFPELSKRAQMSENETEKENAAVEGFAKAWSSITGEKITSIPKPEDCIRELKAVHAGMAIAAELPKYCSNMRDLEIKHADTRFIARYSPFFAVCREILAAETGKGSQKTNLGNCRIIAVAGENFYIELTPPMPDPSKNLVGLFREKNIFYDLATNNILAARVEVLSTAPFKLFGENQAMFTLPAGLLHAAAPVVGDKVLLAPDLKQGMRLIIPNALTANRILYEMSTDEKPGREWHTGRDRFQSEKNFLLLKPASNKQRSITTELGYVTDGPDVRVEASLNCAGHFKIIVAPGIALAFPPSRTNDSGLYFNGHLAQVWTGSWTETSEYHRVGFELTANYIRGFADGATCESPIPLPEVQPEPGILGFRSSSDIRFRSLQVSIPREATKPRILGINESGSELLIHRGESPDWKKLALNTAIYLLDRNVTADPARGTDVLQRVTVAEILELQDDFLIASMPKPAPITESTILSLTTTPSQTAGIGDHPQRHILLGTIWNPPQILASAEISRKNTPILIPQFPAILTPKAFLIGTSGSIVHPYSAEILALSIESATAVDLEEKNGILTCPELVSLLSAGQTALPFVLSRTLVETGTRLDAAGVSMQIPPIISSSSNPGWQIINGNWRDRMGRIASVEATEPAIIRLPGSFWRNVQYDLDVRIEKAATSQSADQEILVDLYLPFLNGGFSFALGSKGTEIGGSRVHPGTPTLANRTEPPAGSDITLEPGYGPKAPVLVANQNYNIRLRRAGDIGALYINGKRIATVSCPEFSGDMILHIANPAGSISMGRSRAMNLGNSVTISEAEPDTGEFGYVLSVNGTSAIVDSDGFGIVPQAKVSIMKVDKVIKGDTSKTILLNRLATGTVTDAGPRTAHVALSAPVTMEPGLKVFRGLLPEVTTLTGSRLTNVDEGF